MKYFCTDVQIFLYEIFLQIFLCDIHIVPTIVCLQLSSNKQIQYSSHGRAWLRGWVGWLVANGRPRRCRDGCERMEMTRKHATAQSGKERRGWYRLPGDDVHPPNRSGIAAERLRSPSVSAPHRESLARPTGPGLLTYLKYCTQRSTQRSK